MSAIELNELDLELGPPQGMSVKEWNQKRREYFSERRRSSIHRTLIDQVGGVARVRATETSRSTD